MIVISMFTYQSVINLEAPVPLGCVELHDNDGLQLTSHNSNTTEVDVMLHRDQC